MSNYIYRFEVRTELKPVNPMYGRTRLICGETDLQNADEAIKKAKEYQKAYPEAIVYAIANQYTCEENAQRHFALQSHCIWHEWLDDAQVTGMRTKLNI